METALPAGTQIFEFGGLVLHGNLRDWQDSMPERVAVHEFDRRAGAQTEPMKSAPRTFRCTLYFVEAAGFAKATQFAALVRENPSRLLIHPLYGRIPMTCKGTEGASWSADNAANAYSMPVEFIEDNLDGQIIAQQAQGVATGAADVGVLAALVLSVVDTVDAATTATAAQIAEAASLAVIATDAAIEFSDATYTAATTDTPAPGLPAMLSTAIAAIDNGIAAVVVMCGGEPTGGPAIVAYQNLAAACLDMGAAYLAQRPPLITYVTPEAMHILVLAQQWYPSEAQARVDEILANNPGVRAGVIPSGTTLKLAAATV
jgi:hypothetical protein